MVRFSVSALLALALSTSSAMAYLYPGQPNCPTYNKSNSWARFMAGEYSTNPFFSIKFDQMTANIGTLAAGRCYTASTDASGKSAVSGYNVAQGKGVLDTRQGQPPLTYTINVWGAEFAFDESGYVYYNGARVGTLKCDIGSSC